ncbi:MAG: DUF3795 domain-containing protein [Ruminococcus sp.]
MKSICGADCENCGYGKKSGCKGCENTGGCPFGKQCFIARYIKLSGLENYNAFKNQLIEEFNSLNIDGMPKINELFALNGSFVNLAYPMPNGIAVKLLDDNAIYLGNQVECEFNDGSLIKCFGLVAGMDFLLVCEYGENCTDPEIIVYKRR